MTLAGTLGTVSQVNAIAESDSTAVYGNYPLYDANDQCTSAQTLRVNSSYQYDLFFLGDSLGVGIKNAGLEDLLPDDWTSEVNVLGSRALTGGAVEDGTTVLNRELQVGGKAAGARIIAIELGTNPSLNFIADVLSKVDQIKSVSPGATILWLDSPATTNGDYYSKQNTALFKAAEGNNDFNMYSLKASVFNGDTPIAGMRATDNIHLTGQGYKKAAEDFAAFVSESYPKGGSGLTAGIAGSSTINWPPEVDPQWIPIWTAAADKHGIDVKLLAAVFTAEHNGKFLPINGGGPASLGGWAQPGSSTATGPFQILNATWDSLRNIDTSLPPRTNRGPSDPRNNPEYASLGAAAYIKTVKGVPGLPAGSSDQPQGFKPNMSEEPYTAASVAIRYNQGGGFHDGKLTQGVNYPYEYADHAVATYKLLGGQDAVGGGSATACSVQGFGGTFGNVSVIDGYNYAFPIQGTKDQVKNGSSWPCAPSCHHNGNGRTTPFAFDLSHDYDNKTDDAPANANVGLDVYAITDGEITQARYTYKGIEGCHTFQITGDDGWMYFHAHIVLKQGYEKGRRVKAGEAIATIGPRKCTGNGSYPHLHIDRGYPKGSSGGGYQLSPSRNPDRDPDFVPLVDRLYEALPGGGV